MNKSFLVRHNSTFGYITGLCVAEIIVSPLNAIRIIYQTTDNMTILQIINNIYYNRGIKGFYNALLWTILSRILTAGLKYFLYNELKYFRETKDNDSKQNLINGCITGIVCPFIIQPIDVILNHSYRFVEINKNLLKLNVLYSGLRHTLIKNIILFTILYPLFDYIKKITNDNILLSSSITCLISGIILQLIDYLRIRSMAQITQNQNLIKNIFACYKGFYINYLTNLLHFTISMLIMRYYLNYFKNKNKQN
jgi:hypothetical protein